METVRETNFEGLELWSRGKVRDIYDMGSDKLLIVATDRVSAFDVVMKEPIPGKGKVLTQLSLFWYQVIDDIIFNHVITSHVEEYPKICQPYADELSGRSMLVRKAKPLPIECVVRGHLSGSGWKSYKKNGTVCGINLPPGLLESQQLPKPIVTYTKSKEGLDENISFVEAADIIGKKMAKALHNFSLHIYLRAARCALKKDIIISDTKLEFGICDNKLILINELLTPDSSGFWLSDYYWPGRSQPSFDKQFLRDYLQGLTYKGEWDKKPPPPPLNNIIEEIKGKYQVVLSMLTD